MDKNEYKNLKNIIQGKEPEKKIQVGYQSTTTKGRPSGENREVGEKWKEDGKTWEKTESGRVQRVSVTDGLGMPYLCPKCKTMMAASKDRKVWYQTGACLNCLVDYHHKLKKLGKFEQFAFRKRLLSAKSYYSEQENQFEDFKKMVNENPEYVHADGVVDRWSNDMDSEKMIEEYKNYLDDYKKRLNESIEKYENQYEESLDEWQEPE